MVKPAPSVFLPLFAVSSPTPSHRLQTISFWFQGSDNRTRGCAIWGWWAVCVGGRLCKLHQSSLCRFVQLIRNLDKRARAWPAYTGIDTCMKNFLVCLPLVQSLSNSAMKERHWKELMDRTNVHFDLQSGFTLAQLLSLNLHEYVDAVGLIVDKVWSGYSTGKGIEKSSLWANMSHLRFGLACVQRESVLTLVLSAPTLSKVVSRGSQEVYLVDCSCWAHRYATVAVA